MDQPSENALVSAILDRTPDAVRAAHEALSGRRDLVKCGRPAKSTPSCGQVRARFLSSCSAHATPAEHAKADVERAGLTALVAQWSASLAPVCHSWDVTEFDRRSVANLAVLSDDELRQARHAYDLIWRWQQGRCAVCGEQAALVEPGWWSDSGFALDHDHRTALVRGYLCVSCNVSEPHGDGGDFTKYRDRPPAVMLGVIARYEHPFYGLVRPELHLDPTTYDPANAAAYRLLGRFAKHMDTAAPR